MGNLSIITVYCNIEHNYHKNRSILTKNLKEQGKNRVIAGKFALIP